MQHSSKSRYLATACCQLALSVGCSSASASKSAPTPRGVSSYLGPSTAATSPNLTLDGLKRIGFATRRDGKILLLLLDGKHDDQSLAEGWPVVKALGLFGSWSRLRSTATPTFRPVPPRGAPPGTVTPVEGVAGFDLSSARYRSSYVTLAHGTIDVGAVVNRTARLRLAGGLPRSDRALVKRYDPTLDFPWVLVGGYSGTLSGVIYGDFKDNQGHTIPFAQVQRLLQHNDLTSHYRLVTSVNAEANVLIALICHADGNRPARACQRAVIRSLERRYGRSQ